MSKQPANAEFFEFNGTLFKKTRKGIHPAPHCPNCLMPMFSLEKEDFFVCANCNLAAEITLGNIDEVLESVADFDG